MTSGTDPAIAFPGPTELGFNGDEERGWTRNLRGREIHFRLLKTLADLIHAERPQLDVFGVSERDLLSAVSLTSVSETGGAVIAAFIPEEPEAAIGVLLGWGGFVRRPRVVSDFMAVRPEARNMGIAAELKRLQAGIALQRGFAEIVWTVDPLRAANARLNFGKLGAISRHYEIDRYGAGFASDLYGGLPTDRIHVLWEITTPRVIANLLGRATDADVAGATEAFANRPGTSDNNALIPIPADIDALLAANPDEALTWRLRLREVLPRAFAEGFAITGFQPAAGDAEPALVLTREPVSVT